MGARASVNAAKRSALNDDADPFATKNANFHKLPPNKTLQKSETVANVPAAGGTSKKKSVSSSLSRPWGVSSHSENEDSKKSERLFGLDLRTSSKQSSSQAKSPSETTKKGHHKEGKGFHFKPRKPSFHGNVDKSKSAVDLSHIGQATPMGQPTPMEDMQVKMASEASRRAEEDRMRRLRLQEEQELAYAIALSKAEAASLKKP